MSKWEQKQDRPVLPLYAAALAWLVASCAFPAVYLWALWRHWARAA